MGVFFVKEILNTSSRTLNFEISFSLFLNVAENDTTFRKISYFRNLLCFYFHLKYPTMFIPLSRPHFVEDKNGSILRVNVQLFVKET